MMSVRPRPHLPHAVSVCLEEVSARQALGLDTSSSGAAEMGVPQPRPAPVTEISLEYPGTSAQAAGNVASLWRADLTDQNVLGRGRLDPGAWNDASLRWLVDPV